MVADNKKDPPPQNLLPQQTNETADEYAYQEWGHSGICYRKNVVNNVINPQLNTRDPSNHNRVKLFELLFITDCIKHVIMNNFNNNII